MIAVLPPETTNRYSGTRVVPDNMDCHGGHHHCTSPRKGKQHTKQQRVTCNHQRKRPPCPVHNKEQSSVFYMNAPEASHTYAMPELIPVQFLQPDVNAYSPVANYSQDEHHMLHIEAEYQDQLRERLRAHTLVDSLDMAPCDSLDDGYHEGNDAATTEHNCFAKIHNTEQVTISTYQQDILATQHLSNSEPLASPSDNMVNGNTAQSASSQNLLGLSNGECNKPVSHPCNALDNSADAIQSPTIDNINDNQSTLPRVTSSSNVDFIEFNKQRTRSRTDSKKSYGRIHANNKYFKVKAEEEIAKTAEDVLQTKVRWLGPHMTRDKMIAKRSILKSKKQNDIITSSIVTCDKTGAQRINVCLELKLPLQDDKSGNTRLDAVCTPADDCCNNSQTNTSREFQTQRSGIDEEPTSDNRSSSSNRPNSSDSTPACNPYNVLPPILSADSSETQQGNEDAMARDIARKTTSSSGYAAQFERNRRKMDYKKYTINDYRRIKNDCKLGGLGPDIANEVLKEKKSNVKRKVEYAKAIKDRNQKSIKQPQAKCITKPRFSTGRTLDNDVPASRRQSAMEYARNVPKPKVQPKNTNIDINDAGKKRPAVSSAASTRRASGPHACFYANSNAKCHITSDASSLVDYSASSRINSRIGTGIDSLVSTRVDSRVGTRVDSRVSTRVDSRVCTRVDFTANTEIEAMQKRHERERQEAEAIGGTLQSAVKTPMNDE